MTTVQLPPAALPGRGGQSGARDSAGSSGTGATAFTALFHGHLTERRGAPAARLQQQQSPAGAGATSLGATSMAGVPGGAAAAGGTSTSSGRPAASADAVPAASQLAGITLQPAALPTGLPDGRTQGGAVPESPVQESAGPDTAASAVSMENTTSAESTTPDEEAASASSTAGAATDRPVGNGPIGSGPIGSGPGASGTAAADTPVRGDLPTSVPPAGHAPAPVTIDGERARATDAALSGTGVGATGTSGDAETTRALPVGAGEGDDAAAGPAATRSTGLTADEAAVQSEDQRLPAGSAAPPPAPSVQGPTIGQAVPGSPATVGAGVPAAPGAPAAADPSADSPVTGGGTSAPSGVSLRVGQDQGAAAGPDLAVRSAGPEDETALPRTEPVAVPQQAAPSSPAASAASAAAATPANPVRPPVPLPQQLGASAFALVQSAAEADGRTSTITVSVAPDDLGPITIRASLSAEGTRLEFFSATDGGREALRQALPELRREASSSGLSAALDLGEGTPDGTGRERLRDEFRSSRDGRLQADSAPGPGLPTPWGGRNAGGSSTLDLFA